LGGDNRQQCHWYARQDIDHVMATGNRGRQDHKTIHDPDDPPVPPCGGGAWGRFLCAATRSGLSL